MECDTVEMPYQRISIEDKQRLVDAHERGEDYVALAAQLGIKRTTAYAIIRRAAERGGIVALPRGGARPQRRLISQALVDAAVDLVEQHPEMTLNQINNQLRLLLPHHAHISRSTLSNMLHGQLIVMKKLEDAPVQRNSPEIKQSRQAFAEWLMQLPITTEVIFIDEAGINLWTKRTRGRARRGERAVRVVRGTRARNFTMTFAVSPTAGIIHSDLQAGGMNGQRFNAFLRDVADRLPDDGYQRVLVFDNAPAHRHAGNVEFPEGKEITVRWLPAYSPMLNIVEQCFSQWKAAMKRDLTDVREQALNRSIAENEAVLCQLAMQNVAVITPENAAAYFRFLQRHLPACILLQDILM